MLGVGYISTGRKAAKIFQIQGLGVDLAMGGTHKVLQTLGVELQSLEEARVTMDIRHDFCPAASIVANPEGWFCQVREDLLVGSCGVDCFGGGQGLRSHLMDDKTFAKMGHPMVVLRSRVDHPSEYP